METSKNILAKYVKNLFLAKEGIIATIKKINPNFDENKVEQKLKDIDENGLDIRD